MSRVIVKAPILPHLHLQLVTDLWKKEKQQEQEQEQEQEDKEIATRTRSRPRIRININWVDVQLWGQAICWWGFAALMLSCSLAVFALAVHLAENDFYQICAL